MPKIIDIRSTTIPISSKISNAYINFSKMDVSAVAIISDVTRNGRPLVGYGFNSNGRYSCDGLLRERFIPRLLNANLENEINPILAWEKMMENEKPGGHGERSVAVGVLDMALWDLSAKIMDVPLYKLIADKWGNGFIHEKIFVYAAGGYYYPNKEKDDLKKEILSYQDKGYRVCKIKIGSDLQEDVRRIEAVLEILKDGKNLAVDANGRLDLDMAIRYAETLKQYDLFWFEEAGDPLNYYLQAELAKIYQGSLATGENLFSSQDGENLLRYGGMRPQTDILQLDCALSYGLVEYKRFLDKLPIYKFSNKNCIPHGGHQMSLNIAAGLGLGGNESYPKIFSPFGGFSDNATIENSLVTLHECPGIGFEQKADLIKVLKRIVE